MFQNFLLFLYTILHFPYPFTWEMDLLVPFPWQLWNVLSQLQQCQYLFRFLTSLILERKNSTPWSGGCKFAGWYPTFTFSILRNRHAVLHEMAATFCILPTVCKDSFLRIQDHNCLFLSFLIMCTLTGRSGISLYFSFTLFWWLVTPFMYLLSICISSLKKV